jgi:hypothetical protein
MQHNKKKNNKEIKDRFQRIKPKAPRNRQKESKTENRNQIIPKYRKY